MAMRIALLSILLSAVSALAQLDLRSALYVPLAFKQSAASAPDVIFSEAFLDFETSSAGTVIDTTIATNSTKGYIPSAYTVTGPITQLKISTDAERAVPASPIAMDVTYTDSGATRGLVMSNIVDSQYVSYNFGANKTTASVGFWIRHTFDGSGVFINPIDISGGGSLAALSVKDGGAPGFAVETDGGDGAYVTVSGNTWYWCSLTYVQNNICTLTVFDTSGAVVGTSTNTTGNNPCNLVRFGRVDAHTASHPSTYYHMDDILIRWATAFKPTGPAADTNAWFPTVTATTTNTLASTSVNVTWTTDDAFSSSKVEYSTDSSFSSNATGADGTNHTVSISGLTANTTYNARVVSTASSKTTTGPTWTFTTTPTASAPVYYTNTTIVDVTATKNTNSVYSPGPNCIVINVWSSFATLTHPVTNLLNGVAMTLLAQTNGYNGGGNSFGVAYGFPTTNGAYNAACNLSSSPTEFSLVTLVYTNVHQTTPFGTAVMQYSATTTTGRTNTVNSATADLIFDAVAWNVGAVGSVGSGQTRRGTADPSPNDASAATSEKASEGATSTMRWSGFSSGVISQIAAAMKGP